MTLISEQDQPLFRQIERFLEKEVPKEPVPEEFGEAPAYTGRGGKRQGRNIGRGRGRGRGRGKGKGKGRDNGGVQNRAGADQGGKPAKTSRHRKKNNNKGKDNNKHNNTQQ